MVETTTFNAEKSWVAGLKSLSMWLAIGIIALPSAASILSNRFENTEDLFSSGSHPIHQYHGWIGAKGLLAKGIPTAFDPAFHAGYIKTPLFDSQAHVIEWLVALFTMLRGPDNSPSLIQVAQYHLWYLSGLVFAIPFFVAVGGRLAGLSNLEALLCALGSEIVMIMPAGSRAIIDGEMGQVLAPSCFAMFIGSLVGYHRRTSSICGIVIFFSYWMLWATSVGTALFATAMLLYYYLRVGLRHESWWHFGLIASLLGALVGNLELFLALRNHWWIQATILEENSNFPGSALIRIVGDSRWGGGSGFCAGMIMLVSGVAGAQWLVWTGRRLAGRMIATTIGFQVLIFAISKTVHLLNQLDVIGNPTSIMLTSTLGFGASLGIQCHGKKWFGPSWLREYPIRYIPISIFSGLLIVFSLINPTFIKTLCLNYVGGCWKLDGPPVWARTVTKQLSEYPAAGGRILWEDLVSDGSNGWSVFLPQILNRGLIGGLSPVVRIEHQQASLREGKLAGRSVLEWTDSELNGFIKTYRINLIVARTDNSISRWSKYPDAIAAKKGSYEGKNGKWVVFKLPDQIGLAVVGTARVVHMGTDKVTLADVVPENGSVVLSLHYQRGMKVRPERVKIERELDSHDPIPLIRLKSDEPISRLELEWDER